MNLYDSTPGARILRFMRSQNWTVQKALSELVDNSFGPARGNASKVEIRHNPRTHTISVLDDGQGMESIGRLFKLGDGIAPTPDDIGTYGNGGTWAILWLADRVTVQSLRNRLVSSFTVDWLHQITRNEFPQIDVSWKRATAANTDAQLLAVGHGTLIEMKLPRGRLVPVASVTRDLSETYATGFRKGKEINWVTERVGSNDVRILKDLLETSDPMTKEVIIDHSFTRGGELDRDLDISGRIGIIPGLSQAKSHVSIDFGYRTIQTTRDCYRTWPTDEDEEPQKYLGNGVAGYIELGPGWQDYFEGTKSGFNNELVWRLLMRIIFKEIEPLLKETMIDSRTMEFADIGFCLEYALNGLRHIKGHADPAGPGTRVYGRGERGGSGGGDDDDGQHATITDPEGKDEAQQAGTGEEKPLPAIARFTLMEESNEQLKGGMYQIEVTADDVIFSVNKDRSDIKIAMESRPVNRLALYLLFTSHIARSIAGDDVAITRFLSPSKRKELEPLTAAEKASRIQAMLMDMAIPTFA